MTPGSVQICMSAGDQYGTVIHHWIVKFELLSIALRCFFYFGWTNIFNIYILFSCLKYYLVNYRIIQILNKYNRRGYWHFKCNNSCRTRYLTDATMCLKSTADAKKCLNLLFSAIYSMYKFENSHQRQCGYLRNSNIYSSLKTVKFCWKWPYITRFVTVNMLPCHTLQRPQS